MQQLVAWMLCMVYLVGVGGVALKSLLCPCVELHQHEVTCCHDHGHTHAEMHPLAAAHNNDFTMPCCDDRHSNRIELYTTSSDEERAAKIVVRNVPSMLFAESSAAEIQLLSLNIERAQERVQLTRPSAVQSKSLRAPPVKA